MSQIRFLRLLAPVLGLLVALAPGPARAAGDEELGWSDTAELSYVVTGGNSEIQTLGFKNTLVRTWESSVLRINAGGVRAETTTLIRVALDQNPDPNVVGVVRISETEDTELTAEHYYLDGRYGHEITKRFFWHAGAGWERNRFAGFDDRYTVLGGVGNLWVDSDRARWLTGYAITYTKQDDVVEDPDFDDSFAGVELISEYKLKIGQNANYENLLTLDGNAEETEDLRADWTNSISVSINTILALKVSLQLLYDAQPALEEVEVFEASGANAGGSTGTTVLVELDEVDSIFTASLVANF